MYLNNKNRVLSIEKMRILSSLGLDTSKASMCWYLRDKWTLFPMNQTEFGYFGKVPTYTLQDILDMLPNYELMKSPSLSNDDPSYDGYSINVIFNKIQKRPVISGNNELEAAYKMLKYCLENRFINTSNEEKLNNE